MATDKSAKEHNNKQHQYSSHGNVYNLKKFLGKFGRNIKDKRFVKIIIAAMLSVIIILLFSGGVYLVLFRNMSSWVHYLGEPYDHVLVENVHSLNSIKTNRLYLSNGSTISIEGNYSLAELNYNDEKVTMDLDEYDVFYEGINERNSDLIEFISSDEVSETEKSNEYEEESNSEIVLPYEIEHSENWIYTEAGPRVLWNVISIISNKNSDSSFSLFEESQINELRIYRDRAPISRNLFEEYPLPKSNTWYSFLFDEEAYKYFSLTAEKELIIPIYGFYKLHTEDKVSRMNKSDPFCFENGVYDQASYGEVPDTVYLILKQGSSIEIDPHNQAQIEDSSVYDIQIDGKCDSFQGESAGNNANLTITMFNEQKAFDIGLVNISAIGKKQMNISCHFERSNDTETNEMNISGEVKKISIFDEPIMFNFKAFIIDNISSLIVAVFCAFISVFIPLANKS